MVPQITICNATFLLPDSQTIILQEGRKGLQNGYLTASSGGKKRKSETLIQCSCREGMEESRVKISPQNHQLIGVMTYYRQKPSPGLSRPDSRTALVFYYKVFTWQGVPQTTKALGEPKEFQLADIPYEKMFPGTDLWFPSFIKGELFSGELHYDEEERVIPHSFTLHSHPKYDLLAFG